METRSREEQVADLLFGTPEAAPEQPDETPATAELTRPDPTPAEVPESPQRAADEGSEEPDPVEVPATLADLAAKLKVEPEQLYSALKIPISGREDGITLGEFKDRAKELLRADQLRQQAEDERAELQAEQVRFRQDLMALTASVKDGKIDQQALQAVRENLTNYQRQQAEIVVKAAPELRDTEQQDRIIEVAARYGIPKAQLDPSIGAGWLLALNRLATLEQRLADAKAGVEKPKPKAPSRPDRLSKAQQRQQIVNQAKGGQLDKTAAVAQLLGNI